MYDSSRDVPTWMPYLDLTCATIATVLWFALPQIGAWPLVLALLPWLLRFISTRRLTQRTPFDLPLALFVLTAALAVWAAYDRETAWSKFWLIVGAVLLFYAFANARATPAMVRVGLLTAFAVGLSLYFLATNDWTLSQASDRDPFGTELAEVPATGAGPTPEPERGRWPSRHAVALRRLGRLKVLAESRGLVHSKERSKLAVRPTGVGQRSRWCSLDC